MKKILLSTLALATITLHSCKKQDENNHLFVGGTTKLGEGSAWAWIQTDAADKPDVVGITIDKKSLSTMPDDGHGGHSHEYSYVLNLPAQKSITPFNHIVLDWNPHGHPPEHVYDLPHFDMHFYMMTEAERMAIPEYSTDSTGFLRYPAPAYLPSTYVPIPGGEAQMGTHWIDLTSPELNPANPQTFTQTFIYGSFNGAVTFYEPMVTLDFLSHTTSFTRDIPQPQQYSRDGYFPTKMSIIDKGATVEVSLHHFVYHARS